MSCRAHALDAAVTVIVLAGLALMIGFPRAATIPFHLIWITVLLLAGLRAWGHLYTDVVLVALGVVTAAVFWRLAVTGAIEAEEIAEAPLMALAFLVSTWQLRRRQAAMDAERESRLAQTIAAAELGHDLRNPLTVARGYVDLIALRTPDPTIRADAYLAIQQMDRLAALARRLGHPLTTADHG